MKCQFKATASRMTKYSLLATGMPNESREVTFERDTEL